MLTGDQKSEGNLHNVAKSHTSETPVLAPKITYNSKIYQVQLKNHILLQILPISTTKPSNFNSKNHMLLQTRQISTQKITFNLQTQQISTPENTSRTRRPRPTPLF
jgi:hypothetical protein